MEPEIHHTLLHLQKGYHHDRVMVIVRARVRVRVKVRVSVRIRVIVGVRMK